ncbi:hypothetical protein KM043_008401 [Ampulex compressa]|nr:hypothetical protein KM043_008401 [Ampulex compressa]
MEKEGKCASRRDEEGCGPKRRGRERDGARASKSDEGMMFALISTSRNERPAEDPAPPSSRVLCPSTVSILQRFEAPALGLDTPHRLEARLGLSSVRRGPRAHSRTGTRVQVLQDYVRGSYCFYCSSQDHAERSNGRATHRQRRDDLQLMNLCVPSRSAIVVSKSIRGQPRHEAFREMTLMHIAHRS